MDISMLTIEDFNAIPDGKVFLRGELPDSRLGLHMAGSGQQLRFVAKKGYGNDWAVYCHFSNKDWEYIEQHGDKVSIKYNILRALPCTEEVFKLYRY